MPHVAPPPSAVGFGFPDVPMSRCPDVPTSRWPDDPIPSPRGGFPIPAIPRDVGDFGDPGDSLPPPRVPPN